MEAAIASLSAETYLVSLLKVVALTPFKPMTATIDIRSFEVVGGDEPENFVKIL